MTPLPICNPPPAERETLPSYLSRLAATWHTEVAALAYDMDAPFKHVLALDPAAMDALASWAGLDARQMAEMLSWTGMRAGNVRMTFRGEVMVSRALRNPVMRGCPVCLRADAARHDGPGPAGMVMRGDWQMRDVLTCVRHGHPLVVLWKADTPRDRYDIAARLREIEPDILSGALDRPVQPVTDYDLWLDGRLRDGRDETRLKGHPLFAATTFCRLLGQALRRDEAQGAADDHRSDHAAGFDIARHGEAAIRAALDRVAVGATRHHDEPAKIFGALYPALNRDYAEEPGFAPFRHLLRESILDHWPVAPGEVLLGEVVTRRRLHSVATAAQAAGVGPQVMAQFLVEAGAIQARDDRPPSRRLLDAQAHDALLAEIPTLVGPNAMRAAMGANRGEFNALVAEGLLMPRTRIATSNRPWRIPDGTALVAELRNGAVPVAADDTDWEPLLIARKRTKVSLSDLIAAIRDRRLAVGGRSRCAGKFYADFRS